MEKETAEAVGDSLRERALTDNISKIECGGCTEQAWSGDPEGIAALVEHAMFHHVTRQSLYGVIYCEVAEPYTIAHRMGLAAQTQHEQSWRDAQVAA
jgi:hypothetical protein